jgi:hypothetical protein
MPSSAAPVRHRRLRRRPPQRRRPLTPAADVFAVELLRLFEEGHRCFCPECRARAREREVHRRQAAAAAP